MPILLFIVFVDLVGFGIIIPLLPFYAEHFGASVLAVTLLMAVYSAMQFVAAPLLGALSDRFGRRRVIALSTFGAALGYLVMGLADSLALLFVARALAGAMAGNIAAAQAYIADVTSPEDRAKGMGLFGAAMGFGFIVGPAIGAALAGGGETVNFSLPPLVAAATSALAGVLALVVLRETGVAAAPRRLSWLAPISAALGNTDLRPLAVTLFLVVFAFAGLETTFALWAERQLAWGPREVGALFAGVGVVAVIVQGGMVGPLSRRLGEEAVVLIGIVALVAGFSLLPIATTLAPTLVAMALLAGGFGLANPALASLVSRRAAANAQGASLGVAQAGASLGRIFGPALAGVLFTSGGQALPYVTSAAILVAVAALWQRTRRLAAQ
jgi:MFS transporter, DHA1 family, tetracycline resistance protein